MTLRISPAQVAAQLSKSNAVVTLPRSILVAAALSDNSLPNTRIMFSVTDSQACAICNSAESEISGENAAERSQAEDCTDLKEHVFKHGDAAGNSAFSESSIALFISLD